MRFLLGIIIGGVLTLFVATAMDAPTHPVLDKAQGALVQIWNRLISTTSDSLFEDAEAGGVRAPTEVSEDPLSALLPARLPPESPAALPATALNPATALRAPPAVAAPPPADAMRHPAPVATSEQPPGPSLERPRATAEPVWEPFHSHMSAEGFAARLSRELEHEFRVERQAAGAYQVVFNVVNPAQRQALLAQISEITGQ